MAKLRWCIIICALGIGWRAAIAATFPGNANLQVTDPNGGLSETNQNQFSISLWLKLSVPSDITLSNDMVVIANRTTGSTNDPHAYLIKYNYQYGRIEFSSKGSSGAFVGTLIDRPYLDRWYHIAVRRQNEVFDGFVDGTRITSFVNGGTVGNAANKDGVSIGGWNNSKFLYGEVQEVAIYQEAMGSSWFVDYMYQDQPTNWPTLRGYFKLGYSTNTADTLFNYATNVPTGAANATKIGSGDVLFEEVNQLGEQSIYDSKRNNGRDAISPLSGSFTWSQVIFQRPVPGIAFLLEYGYNSGNRFSGYKIGDADVLGSSTMGSGWRHSFDTQVVPSQMVQPTFSDRTIGIMTWDGGVEIWDKSNSVFQTRHKEYRGEVVETGDGHIEWTTPTRLIYRFRAPYSGSPSAMRGRLEEIRDFNSNVVHVLWQENAGRVTQVVDTAGGRYDFSYSGQYLTNVAFGGWSVGFEYNASNQLTSRLFRGPAGYSNVNTRWTFQYDATNGLINIILDPRSNAVISVSYDKYGRKTNEVDGLGRTRSFEYAIPGRRDRRLTDQAGQKWVETLDRKGRLIALQNPLTDRTTYAYDDRGNVIATVQPLGWRTTYSYDERANKTAETNELGQVTQWTYNYFNKATSETNPAGWVTRWTYDAAGNLLDQSDDLGTMAIYTYETNGLVKTAADANGNTTTFAYDTNGFLTATTDPAGNTTRLGVNEWNWKLAITNALGQVTRMSYDINGNVLRTEDPISRIFTSTYDPNGNVVSRTDGKGQYTYYTYDAANQRTQTVDRAGATNAVYYNPRGDIDKLVNANGEVVSNTYDAAARLITVTDPLANRAQREYDANNNVIATIDPLGRRSTTTYDRLNRVIAQTDPQGNTAQTTYDDVGRIKSLVTPNGFATEHDYDGRGRLTRWLDAEGYEWRYEYDGVGNITNIIDALGGHYVMTYGSRNERLSELNQDGDLWRYTYDELTRLKTQTDPNGTVRTLNYDAAARLETVEYNSGRVNSFVYDDNDNPEMGTRLGSGPTTTTRLSFDAMDRIIECRDQFNKRISITYDRLGRRTSLAYPDGKIVTNQYDALNRLTNSTDWASRQMKYTYDRLNRLLTRTFPNGIVQSNAYDEAGRQIDMAYWRSATNALIALNYAYDRNGNKTSHSEAGALDWTKPTKIDESARYTPANKLIDRVDDLSVNDWVYHYDPSGNMTNAVGSGQGFSLWYDEDNRVTQLRWEAGIVTKTVSNRMDAVGRRIARTIDGMETRFVLDLSLGMEMILCDTDVNGTIQRWYVHGPGGLEYSADATNALLCYHADAQGNIIALTDSATNAIARYAYTPYGRIMPGSTMDDNPYRYVGAMGVMNEFPALSGAAGDPALYFMRARYYSADAGVFLSTDPVKQVGPGWLPSMYLYASGNPVRRSDPNGKSPIETILVDVAGKVSGFVSGYIQAAVIDVSGTYIGALADVLMGYDEEESNNVTRNGIYIANSIADIVTMSSSQSGAKAKGRDAWRYTVARVDESMKNRSDTGNKPLNLEQYANGPFSPSAKKMMDISHAYFNPGGNGAQTDTASKTPNSYGPPTILNNNQQSSPWSPSTSQNMCIMPPQGVKQPQVQQPQQGNSWMSDPIGSALNFLGSLIKIPNGGSNNGGGASGTHNNSGSSTGNQSNGNSNVGPQAGGSNPGNSGPSSSPNGNRPSSGPTSGSSNGSSGKPDGLPKNAGLVVAIILMGWGGWRWGLRRAAAALVLWASIAAGVDRSEGAGMSGTINYTGLMSGPIVVIADGGAAGVWTNSLSTTGMYAFVDIVPDTSYALTAWRDFTGNGQKDAWEAQGVYSGNPVSLSTNNIPNLDITLADPKFVVAGTATYSGGQTGSICVGISSEPTGTNVLSLAEVHSIPGTYVITNVPGGGPIYIWAYMDSNANGSNDAGEASYLWDGLPIVITGDLADVSVTLLDPDTDYDDMPDWWEVKYGLNPTNETSIGDETDGALGVPANTTQYLASVCAAVSGVNLPGSTRLNVSTTNGFLSNDTVMIIGMQDPDTNAEQNVAGRYEFHRIRALTNGAIILINPLSWDCSATASQKIQVVRVPEFSSVVVSGALKCASWDGATGGVLAFRARSLYLASNATVSVLGTGYRGGAGVPSDTDYGWGIAGERTMGFSGTNREPDSMSRTNGGGGAGRGADGSGGGGGYGTAGTNGAKHLANSNYGRGAAAFGTSALARLYFGGGGGGSGSHDGGRFGVAGGNGGGCVYIACGIANGSGLINAAGAAGSNGVYVTDNNSGSGGGGGAGGSVYLRSGSVVSTLTINASGGLGGVKQASAIYGSNGGAGGDGRIRCDLPAMDMAPLSTPAIGYTGVCSLITNDAYADADNDNLNNLQEYQNNCNPTNADTDVDGMPDGWEVNYGTGPTNPSALADSDGDGLNNLLEFLKGSRPDEDDSDGDGFSDDVEYTDYGTSLTSTDTDGDGMPDAWEILHGLNPNMDDSSDDRDFDWVTNIQEFQNSLNPHAVDTDNTGTNDYRRLNHGMTGARYTYDRVDRLTGATYEKGMSIAYVYDGNGNIVRQTYLDFDQDDDGLLDLWELQNGLSYTSALDTNGLAGDWDGDGWSNYQEAQAGTSPTNAQSIPDILGPAGTNIATYACHYAVSNFVMAVGQLDGGGAEELVIGADGNPGNATNSLLVLTQTTRGWTTNIVNVGTVGVTSIAIGQISNVSAQSIYIGTRQEGGTGTVIQIVNTTNGWVTRTIAYSPNAAACVLGVRADKDLIVTLAHNGHETSLVSLVPTTSGAWITNVISAAESRLGADFLGKIDTPQNIIRRLDAGGLELDGETTVAEPIATNLLMGPALAMCYKPSADSSTQEYGVAMFQDTYYGTVYGPGPNGTNALMSVGGWGDEYRSFIRFDHSCGPSADAFTGAFLNVYVDSLYPNDPQTQIYPVTSPWTEATMSRSTAPSIGARISTPGNLFAVGWHEIDISQIYNDWQSNVSSNWGLALYPGFTSNARINIATKDNPDQSLWPYVSFKPGGQTVRPYTAFRIGHTESNAAIVWSYVEDKTHSDVIDAGDDVVLWECWPWKTNDPAPKEIARRTLDSQNMAQHLALTTANTTNGNISVVFSGDPDGLVYAWCPYAGEASITGESGLSSGLASYWALDELDGDAVDEVGGKTLANNGMTPYMPAKLGNGAGFNGSSMYLGRTSELVGITNTWSISCWVKFHAAGANEPIVQWTPASGDNNRILIEKNSADRLRVVVVNTNRYKDYRGSTTLTAGAFHHIVVTWNGPNLSLYVDGVAESPTKTLDQAVTMTDSARISGFGGWPGGNYGNITLDEVGLWTRALTIDEISDLYNDGNGLPYSAEEQKPGLFCAQYAGGAWHKLSSVRTLEPGEGLVGLLVVTNTPNTCQVILWPPAQNLWTPAQIKQTAPLTQIMPEPSLGVGTARVDVKIWDAEGNKSLPELQYQLPGSTNWISATVASIDGTTYSLAMAVAALPTGAVHQLRWDALADLGLGYTNIVKLRARSRDLTMQGDWSASVPYQVINSETYDGDADMLPDMWENGHNLDSENPGGDNGASGDTDRDGASNWDEYVADTDPGNPDSLLSITGIQYGAGGAVINWVGGTGVWQYVDYGQASMTGVTWNAVFTNHPPTGSSAGITNSAETNQAGWYRVRAVR